MKRLNKIASAFCAAALGVLALTSCEGGDLYGVNAPDWIAEKVDSIKQANTPEELVGMMDDYYPIGETDFSAPFWTLGKTYVVPAGTKWNAEFTLTVNPDNKYYKNFYIVLNAYNGNLGSEYGVIRFDNDPSKNSEWNTVGTEIDRGLIEGNFTNSSGSDDVDASVQKMNGQITLTVDRTDGGLFIKMTNGTLVKTYTQKTAFPSTGSDVDIACRIGVEGSLVSFLATNVEPIGGCTSAEDKQPVSMTLKGLPKKVLQGTDFEAVIANVTADVQFEQQVSATVKAADLTFQVVPDFSSLGKKTLVAAYSKTFKGENAATPVIATAEFEVVDKMYTCIGSVDNTSAWWTEFSDLIKVGPNETFVSTFTNFTSGANNWNNFCVALSKADLSLGAAGEYAVVRADNYGWGNGYAACTPVCDNGGDWATWLSAMDGAKVTTYITNNGDGTADVKAVIVGNDGKTYTQEYNGINNVDPNDFNFRFVVDNSHIEFDNVVGAEDNSSAWWTEFSALYNVPAGQTVTTRIVNYTSGANNWNNFCVALVKADLNLGAEGEYAVVRADNYGWGNGYAACTPVCDNGGDWATWLQAMDDAKVTVSITNKGDGTADVKAVIIGNDGNTYRQEYNGINTIDPNDLNFRFVVDNSHLVFE